MRINRNIKRNTIVVLVGAFIITMYCLASYNENHYTRTGQITHVSPFCYELTDETGHSFEFITNDIFKDGTVITAVLDNKGSIGYVYDDEVIDYKIVFDSEN